MAKRKIKPRAKPPEEKLVRAAQEHLYYEIWMLLGTARALATTGSYMVTQNAFIDLIIQNTLIESFTMHARILLDFLYTQSDSGFLKPDDLIAEDFFEDERLWAKHRPDKSELLSRIHRRVGKEVAHLTYTRLDVTKQEKPWDYLRIAREIQTVLDSFLELAPHSRARDCLGNLDFRLNDVRI